MSIPSIYIVARNYHFHQSSNVMPPGDMKSYDRTNDHDTGCHAQCCDSATVMRSIMTVLQLSAVL